MQHARQPRALRIHAVSRREALCRGGYAQRTRTDQYRPPRRGGRGVRGATLRADDEVRVVSSPGHRVTCTRWFAHHDPRDAQALLNSEIFGNCVIAAYTKKYVRAAAHEKIG